MGNTLLLFIRRILIIFSLLLFRIVAIGQVSVGAGMEYGLPFCVDKQGYYNVPVIGLHAGIKYAPPNSLLFPSFTCLLSYAQLPIFIKDYNNLNIFATHRNYMINMNYRSSVEDYHYLFFAGIGVSQLLPHGDVYSGASTISDPFVDNYNTHIAPAANIGVNYRSRVPIRQSLYGVGEVRLTYVKMLTAGSEYYITSGSKQLPVTLGGNIIIPSVSLSLYYTFEREKYK